MILIIIAQLAKTYELLYTWVEIRTSNTSLIHLKKDEF